MFEELEHKIENINIVLEKYNLSEIARNYDREYIDYKENREGERGTQKRKS